MSLSLEDLPIEGRDHLSLLMFFKILIIISFSQALEIGV